MEMNDETSGGTESGGLADNRPLEERIGDKNWKTRATAYTDLKNLLKSSFPDDPIFDEYASWMAKLSSDSNASALDTGLDTVLLYVDMAPVSCIRQCADRICDAIIDKALSANKASSQQKGKAIILKLIEVDDPTTCANILRTKFTDKKPKIPPTCLSIILEGIGLFGVRPFPVKEIISSLPPVLEGSNSAAREIAMTLIVEMTRWIGRAPLNSLIDGMRSAQKTDYERLVTAREEEPKPTPTLYLRKDRAAATAATANSTQTNRTNAKGGPTISTADEGAIDPREFVEEVDLNKRLQKTEYNTLIHEEKWNEQLKALQLVIDIIGPTPKLKAGTDTYDILDACKGFLRQGHVQLQVSSLRIIGLLADGLRAEFGHSMRSVSQSIIMKCKEKRLTGEVTFVLMNALRYCLGFDSLLDDICEHIRNKKTPPHGRVCLMEFTSQALKESPERMSAETMKPLVDTLVSICEDSDPKVRDCACVTLGVLAVVIRSKGRNAADAHRTVMGLEQSVPRVFKKIQTAMESGSEAPSPIVAAAAAPPPSAPSLSMKPSAKAATLGGPAAPSSSSSAIQRPSNLKKATTTKTTGVAKKASTLATGGGGGSSSQNNVNDDNVEDLTMSPEEASIALSELGLPNWEGGLTTLLASSKWQDKVEALERIERHIKSESCGGRLSAPFVSYCKGLFPQYKITNVNVFKAILQTLTTAAQHSGDTQFSRSAAMEILVAWGDKMSDKKTSDLISSLLTALSESISPGFTFKQMKKIIDKTKAPLAHQHFLDWLKSSIAEFGAANFPIQLIASFCQTELDNKTATVRTSAVEVLGALYYQLGTRFTSMAISDTMKPALKSLVETEFQRVGYDPNAASKASRAIKGSTSTSTSGLPPGGLLPRVDLHSLLDRNVLTDLINTDGKNSWQLRKVALENLIMAFERSGHFIEYNSLIKELLKSLKDRLVDTQANLKPLGAIAIGHLLSSLEMEQSFKLIRGVIGDSLVAGVSDNKKVMRDACISSLQMIVTNGKDGIAAAGTAGAGTAGGAGAGAGGAGTGGVVPEATLLIAFLPSISEAALNPVGRLELLGWLLSQLELATSSASGSSSGSGSTPSSLKGIDWTELLRALVVAMQDKIAATRGIAEQIFCILMSSGLITRNDVSKSFRDLPPATLRPLQTAVDRILSTPSSTSAPAPAAAVGAAAGAPTSPLRKESSHQRGGGAGGAASRLKSSATAATAVQETASGGGDDSKYFPLKKTNKTKRVEEILRSNWPQPPEDPGESEFNYLKSQWEPLLAPELFALFFPESKSGLLNQDSLMSAMTEMASLVDDTHTSGSSSGLPYGPHTSTMVLQHTDLMLRWCALTLCLRESSSGLMHLLLLLSKIFEKIRSTTPSSATATASAASGSASAASVCSLHDGEIITIIPALIEKCGHKSERHKAAFKSLLLAARYIIPVNKYCQLLLQGLRCKNKKTRVVVIEIIDLIIAESGPSVLGKQGIKEISSIFNLHTRETDVGVRNAALDFCFTLYVCVGSDKSKLMKLLGEITEKAIPMIEHRIKEKVKSLPSSISRQQQQQHQPLNQSLSLERERYDQEGDRDGDREPDEASYPEPYQEPTLVLTPLDNRAAGAGGMAFQDESYEPFRLEMTPPEAMKRNNSSKFNQEGTPKPKRRESLKPTVLISSEDLEETHHNHTHRNSEGISEFESVCVDVVLKVDTLLSSSTPNKTLAMGDRGKDLLLLTQEAKDYLKILHALIKEEWVAPEFITRADNELLCRRVPSFIDLSLRCLDYGFSSPSSVSVSVSVSVDPSDPLLRTVDVGLVSISLAILFALLERKDLCQALTGVSVQRLLESAVRYLMDPRLNSASGGQQQQQQQGLSEIQSSLSKGLTALIFKLSSQETVPPGVMMCAIIETLLLCIPEKNHSRALSVKCIPPLSKVLLQLMSHERSRGQEGGGRGGGGAYRSPHVDTMRLVAVLNSFFNSHPANSPSETAPYSCAKTLLAQLLDCLGIDEVMKIMKTLKISPQSFIYRLVGRLSKSAVANEKGPLSNPEGIRDDIVAIIERITSSRDKSVPIKELHAILKSNPEIDATVYLQHISSAFRRFVLDTLIKLDASENSQNIPSLPHKISSNTMPLDQSSSASGAVSGGLETPSKSGTGTGAAGGTGGAEALRILEGLKSRPKTYRGYSGINPPTATAMTVNTDLLNQSQQGEMYHGSSDNLSVTSSRSASTISRAQIQDKIRGTLSSISASLSLEPTPGSPLTRVSSAHNLFPHGADSDLAARIQRLKGLSEK